MSFLEMLDVVNEGLIKAGQDPIAFDSDCREGICGTCGCMVDGVAHGPDADTTVCQLHMRRFKDGDTIVIEPWRARAFPILKDLVVDRSAFDRIIQAGGYTSINVGSAPDGNAILIPKAASDEAMDYAQCIGCGACVASCKNASAALFTAAKCLVSHILPFFFFIFFFLCGQVALALLPQGQPERLTRVRAMVDRMDAEGFGACSNEGECEATCPKGISIAGIARMNRQYTQAVLTRRPSSAAPGTRRPRRRATSSPWWKCRVAPRRHAASGFSPRTDQPGALARGASAAEEGLDARPEALVEARLRLGQSGPKRRFRGNGHDDPPGVCTTVSADELRGMGACVRRRRGVGGDRRQEPVEAIAPADLLDRTAAQFLVGGIGRDRPGRQPPRGLVALTQQLGAGVQPDHAIRILEPGVDPLRPFRGRAERDGDADGGAMRPVVHAAVERRDDRPGQLLGIELGEARHDAIGILDESAVRQARSDGPGISLARAAIASSRTPHRRRPTRRRRRASPAAPRTPSRGAPPRTR